MFKFGLKSTLIISTVNRYLELCARETIKITGIDISVPDWGGLRTAAYQHSLFLQKWSTADGYEKISDHQLTDNEGKSKALDLCAYYQGKQNWNKERLSYISGLYAATFERLKAEGKIPHNVYLHCGSLWVNKDGNDGMGWDRPHFYISTKPQVPKLK